MPKKLTYLIFMIVNCVLAAVFAGVSIYLFVRMDKAAWSVVNVCFGALLAGLSVLPYFQMQKAIASGDQEKAENCARQIIILFWVAVACILMLIFTCVMFLKVPVAKTT